MVSIPKIDKINISEEVLLNIIAFIGLPKSNSNKRPDLYQINVHHVQDKNITTIINLATIWTKSGVIGRATALSAQVMCPPLVEVDYIVCIKDSITTLKGCQKHGFLLKTWI